MLLLLVLGFVVYFQLPCIFVLCRIQLSFIHASVLCVTPRLEITHHSQCNCNVTHRSSIAQFCTQKIKLIFLAYIYLYYIVWNDNFRITLHTNRFHSIKTWRCFQFICDRWWNMDNIVVMTQSLLTQHNIFFFVVYFIDHRKLILRYIEPRTRKIILTMLTKQRYGNYAQYTLAMIYIFVCSGDSCCPRTLQFEWNNSWQTTHTHTIAIHIEQLSRR